MKKQNISGFATKIAKMCDRKRQFPINGQLELTYRCNLNCIHCYCKEMENKDQIGKVKAFTHQLFGRDKKRFKYGPFIFPRLNGDKAPCDHRLSPEELLKIRHSDSDMWQEYKKDLCEALPKLKREKDYLYHCNSWMTNFFITPYGRLKFCALTDNFSTDLKKEKFREGFYNIFPRLLYEKFKTKSECRNCRLRPVCYQCPGRAYLETGDEEAPVQYYCKLAKAILKDKHSFN